jgi:uncharacterized integral membrane protein (TIGR00698 family)
MNRIILSLILGFLIYFKISPQWSILAGIGLSFILKLSASDKQLIKLGSTRLLQGSIILLGGALNFYFVLQQGLFAVLLTFTSIVLVLIMGEILARFFKVAPPLSHLVSVGTAICGGSAIGAVGPVLKADQLSLATSLGMVFLLNALAVFIFPPVGSYLNLGQEQFGTWAALAIHDTSAVVAAATIYGEKALSTATTLKLTRALWIIPVALLFSVKESSKSKLTFPWFILFFLLLSILFTIVSPLSHYAPYLRDLSKIGFSLTLFLIGLSLNREQLKLIEAKTVAYGVTLWLLTLGFSLIYVYFFLARAF